MTIPYREFAAVSEVVKGEISRDKDESLSYFHLMTLPYREFAAVWMTFMDD